MYATGVPCADKNFAFKISMPYKLFTYTSTLVPGAVPSFSSIKLLTTIHYSAVGDSSLVEQENFQLDPWWITGFVDGEGCFDVSITENKELNQGWEVQHRFSIVLHVKDKAILQNIKKHTLSPLPLGGGGDQRGPTGDPPRVLVKFLNKDLKQFN